MTTMITSEPAVSNEFHAGAAAPRSLDDQPHDPHLAHHFDNPAQQFEAAKLGMWLFLATEFLLFGGLFCLYAVLRGNHPELFAYGSRFLNTNLGFLNTIVLILSSLTMAFAVRCAQLDQRWRLMACLTLTLAGGATFMTVKYFEYSHKLHQNLVWGIAFYDEPKANHAADESTVVPTAIVAAKHGNPDKGKTLWMGTCRTCHDVDGRGVAGQGKDIRGSSFIAGKTDEGLVEFVKVGRMPFDKLNTTGIQMPPRGGNPLLKDADLLDIIAFVRTFKAPDASASAASQAGSSTQTAASAPVQEFYIPMSSIPDAMPGPEGLAANWDAPKAGRDRTAPTDPRRDDARPPNTHLFFGLYYLMTGLHGIHVLLGMLVISWLLVRAWLGHFSGRYFTPVDLVGLYWHVVDVIWIFLFPLLYLIH